MKAKAAKQITASPINPAKPQAEQLPLSQTPRQLLPYTSSNEPMATNHEIVQAYRSLYRQGLLACRRAKPARYALRDHLRAAFANSPRESYDPAAIEKTLTFLSNAALYTGVEQKVVRNLLYVWRTRERSTGNIKATPPKHARNDAQYRQDAYSAFDRDLDMMNKTLGTCIK